MTIILHLYVILQCTMLDFLFIELAILTSTVTSGSRISIQPQWDFKKYDKVLSKEASPDTVVSVRYRSIWVAWIAWKVRFQWVLHLENYDPTMWKYCLMFVESYCFHMKALGVQWNFSSLNTQSMQCSPKSPMPFLNCWTDFQNRS